MAVFSAADVVVDELHFLGAAEVGLARLVFNNGPRRDISAIVRIDLGAITVARARENYFFHLIEQPIEAICSWGPATHFGSIEMTLYTGLHGYVFSSEPSFSQRPGSASDNRSRWAPRGKKIEAE